MSQFDRFCSNVNFGAAESRVGGLWMALGGWRFAFAMILGLAPSVAMAADLQLPPPASSAPATYTPAAGRTDWIVTLGVMAEAGPAWPGAPFRDVIFWGWPIISIHKPGTLPDYFSGADSAGFPVLDTAQFKVGPAFKFIQERREASYAGLSGLGDVNYAILAGGYAEYWPVQWLRLRGEVLQGFNGETGVTGNLFLDAVIPAGPFRFGVGPRFTFQSSNAVGPYFNVTAAQSAASGLPIYSTSGGFYSWGVGGKLDYFMSQQWAMYAFTEYAKISGSAADSPIVTVRGTPDQFSFGLGASYSFSMKPLW
jgi:MipA family protein